MTPTELETAIDAKWRAFLAACMRKDTAATELWHQLKHLRDQRTAEQTALALFRAGLNPDGSRIAPEAKP